MSIRALTIIATGPTLTRLSVFLVSALTLLLGATQAKAQTLSNMTPISFGEMVVGGSGTVTIPTFSDTRSTTGSVALVGTALVQRASLDITYTPGAQIIISFPASIVMSGPNSPTIVPELGGAVVQTMPASGVLTIYFGATITFTTFGATGTLTVDIPVNVDPL
jgi:Domain of unknown function (DUF4402)